MRQEKLEYWMFERWKRTWRVRRKGWWKLWQVHVHETGWNVDRENEENGVIGRCYSEELAFVDVAVAVAVAAVATVTVAVEVVADFVEVYDT